MHSMAMRGRRPLSWRSQRSSRAGVVYRIESVRPGYPKPWCDVSRPDWKVILQEWKDQTRLYFYLCEGHAHVFLLW